MKVWIGADHAGFELKETLKQTLTEVDWKDVGPSTADRVDYPDFAKKVADAVQSSGDLGILICGSGIGMCIAANKIKGVRAAEVENPLSARLTREHNHANILCLGARILGVDLAVEIARVFLTTPPSLDERHQKRVQKISDLEDQQ